MMCRILAVIKTEEAIFAVNDYYRRLGLFKEAYRISKTSTKASNSPNIKYNVHLNNCIACKKYAEAHRIINEGKECNDPRCWVVHAGMYTLGKGEKKDFSKAESLLRYAADTLDYYPAYKGLSELYKEFGREGSKFWFDLYQVKFSNRIDGNNYE